MGATNVKTHPYKAQLQRIRRARARLVLDQPFFGVLALRLTLKIDDTCETAWTDGTSIGFSPTFADKLSDDETLAVFCHEVMHCACGHPWRRDNRNAERWNIAADYAINGILQDAGFRLPACALLDKQWHGKAAEWIYDRLPTQQQQGSNGQGKQGEGNDPSKLGEVRDAPQGQATDGQGNPVPTLSQADWQQATTQARHVAQSQGKLPAGMARAMDQALAARTDWRSLLRKYIQEVVRSDYSWQRPNARYLASGLYLPALHSVACGPIAVAVDTSGSIDSVLLSQFGKEIEAIAAEVQPAHVDVIYCDTEVNRSERFERGESI